MKRNTVAFGAFVLATVAATSGPVLAATTEPASTESAFNELLAMMPAEAIEADGALVFYSDMTLVWERVGAGADEGSRLDAIGELSAPDTYALTPQLFGQNVFDVDAARAEVGFDFFEIDRELAVMAPPRSILIDVITAEADAVTDAIESNPIWSERATMVDADHGAYIDWGDGSEPDMTAISPFRPLGQAGQLAIFGDPATTVRTFDAGDVETVLSATAGEGESATANDIVGAVAGALGDAEVLQAVIQPSPTVFTPPLTASPEQIEAILADAKLVEPYLGIAIVEHTDGDATTTEALLVYADDATAADNVVIIETALAEGFDFATMTPLADIYPDATVSAAGNVVRVDVSGEGSFHTLFNQLTQRGLFPS